MSKILPKQMYFKCNYHVVATSVWKILFFIQINEKIDKTNKYRNAVISQPDSLILCSVCVGVCQMLGLQNLLCLSFCASQVVDLKAV